MLGDIIKNIILTIIIIVIVLIVNKIYLRRIINNIKSEINEIKEVLSFQQSFNIQLQKSNNKNFKLQGEELNLRSDYLLLLFSKKVKINLLLLRINLFRKIINSLLSTLITNNSEYLRRTSNKFNDILKPSANKNKFFIIYCKENININNVSDKKINIIIDFMMFIHNYTSEKIHFNKNKNIPEIFNTIKSEQNSENSDVKTNASFNAYELIDYIFNEYDLEKDMKKLIDNTHKELKEEEVKGTNIIEPEDEKKNKKEIENLIENDDGNIDEVEKNIQNNNEQENKTKRNKRKKRKNKKKRFDVNTNNNNANNSEEEIINNSNKKEKGTSNVNEPVKNNNNVKGENTNFNKEEDINNNNHKNEVNNIPRKNFRNFINSLNENFDESEIEIIKNIYDNSNHNDYSIKENIKLLKDIKNDEITINNKKNFYAQNITNFKFENIEEYSIEKMYEIYKLNFDINSDIYTKINGKDLSNHYRFNISYLKLIDINIINSYKLNDLKEDLKKITHNDLINLLLEDKGKFGSTLNIEDIN